MISIGHLSHILLLVIPLVLCNESKWSSDYPFRWDEAPSSLNEYPLVKDCFSNGTNSSQSCRLIEAWNYIDRLGLYKIVIGVTSPLMPFCSSGNEWNILFGLPSQFSWQWNSNRLFSNGTLIVSPDSWWGSANYYLSVIPFLAALDVGLIPYESFRIIRQGNFCSTVEECDQQIPDAMIKWRLFFSNIAQTNYCSCPNVNAKVIDQCYLKPMWNAHMSSIENALPLIASKIHLLPSINEQRFGLSWSKLVDFIGQSRKNTNLIETNRYQEMFFPQRMLTDEDHPPHCPDFPEDVNKALHLLLSIHDDWYPTLRELWKPATCNFPARLNAQHVFEVMAKSITEATEFYFAAVLESKLSPCDQLISTVKCE